MSKTKKRLWDMVIALFVGILVCMLISKGLTGWESLFSYRVFFIMSESMEPEIKTNQLVFGRLFCPGEEPEVGQIYAYRKVGVVGSKIVIHRLIAINKDGTYLFKGDHNDQVDETVLRENIGYIII